MNLPGQLEARYAFKGIVLLIAGLAFLASVAFGVTQTVRLEGFRLWPIEIEGQRPRADRLAAELAAIARAQELAEQLARNERLVNEQEYRDIASAVDRGAKVDLTVSMDAADRYIAANRVRWQWPEGIQCPGAGTAAGSDRAGNPQGAGTPTELDGARDGLRAGTRRDGLVVVNENDIRICTENTVKAEAGRKFAIEVEQASRSEPED